MSYDLFFTQPEITWDQFAEYFRERKNYTLHGKQSVYENQDTGVYFLFEFADDASCDTEPPECKVTFNLNYYRPHVFAREAEPEIRAFVDRFRFMIYDPQIDGMGEGAYSSEGFIRGWNCGNEFGYQSMLNAENPSEIHARPKEELEAVWKWNFSREQMQNALLDVDVFVPKIWYANIEGNLGTAVIWGDAIPTLIPEVDYLIIPRKEIAPRRFFKRREDICCVPFKEALQVISPFRTDEFLLPSMMLPSPKSPDRIVRFVKGLSPYQKKFSLVSMDNVLNSEIVDKYRKG